MSELKVHASLCEIEPMVQTEEIRAQFVKRLKAALANAGVADWGAGVRLSQMAGTTPKAAGKWLNGESMPGRANLLAIATSLSVRSEWLQYGRGAMLYGATDEEITRTAAQEMRLRLEDDLAVGHDSRLEITVVPLPLDAGRVPVLGKAMLGMDGYFDAMDYPVGHGDGYLGVPSSDPDAYALRVVGSSMTPRIKSGEFVLIEPNLPYANGDDVLVKTASGRSMIKEFVYLRDGQYRFDSYGQGHEPIYLDQSEVMQIHFVGGIFKSYRYQPG